MFAEVDALPGSEMQASISQGYGQALSEQRGLQMCRHIVRPFVGVLVVGSVFGSEPVEMLFEIRTNIGAGILVEGQRGGGVS